MHLELKFEPDLLKLLPSWICFFWQPQHQQQQQIFNTNSYFLPFKSILVEILYIEFSTLWTMKFLVWTGQTEKLFQHCMLATILWIIFCPTHIDMTLSKQYQ